MIRLRWYVLAALVTVSLAGVAFAQGPGPGRGGRGGPGGPGFQGGPGFVGLPLRELNLTDAQQQLVRNITQQYREQNQKLADQVRQAMEAQRKAMETIPINEGMIRSAAQALGDAQTEMAVQQARMFGEIFGVLTPVQQEQAKKLLADREARISQRRERSEQRRPQQQ
jgi:Spy/CpxP family protein refolding chaperone